MLKLIIIKRRFITWINIKVLRLILYFCYRHFRLKNPYAFSYPPLHYLYGRGYTWKQGTDRSRRKLSDTCFFLFNVRGYNKIRTWPWIQQASDIFNSMHGSNRRTYHNAAVFCRLFRLYLLQRLYALADDLCLHHGFQTYMLEFYTFEGLRKAVAFDGILATLTLFIFNIIFISHFQMGIKGFMIAMILSDLCSGIFLWNIAGLASFSCPIGGYETQCVWW